MPLNNKIQVLNLSDKAVQLRAEGLSFRQISQELTKRAKQPITYHVVQKFFSKREHDAIEVVGKSDKLKTKIVEAEINTIEECMKCLSDLQDVFDRAMEDGDLRAAIMATGEKWKGIDIINKVLGKYQVVPINNMNFTEVNIDGARERLISRIASITSKTCDVEGSEFTEPR